ncbi:hypothetical protein KBD81_04305 [Candidatus Woesebacteria bacterium]|nr:hypothetical protein [Candidatus Woesebacteria bacterium]
MPKKTKLQKLKAKDHRIQKAIELEQAATITPVIVKKTRAESKTEVPAAPASLQHNVFAEDNTARSVFKNELSKTLMIAVFIICIQVGLYVLQISGTIDVSTFITF